MSIIQDFINIGIKYVVFPNEMREFHYIIEARNQGIQCISSIDTRSAIYMATGIAAQRKDPVVCFSFSNNSSRSAFSGMTEAFYRQLPVLLVTFGNELDYSRELNDVVFSHHVIDENDSIAKYLNGALPMHIELHSKCVYYNIIDCLFLQQVLCDVLDEDTYLYYGSSVNVKKQNYRCKMIIGGTRGCNDGALANVLGASLAKRRRKYIGVISENEFFHDMNSLGNVNTNTRLCFILIVPKFNIVIDDYAKSLGFETRRLLRAQVNNDCIRQAVYTDQKILIQIEG